MRASLQTLAALDAKTVLYCHAPVEAGPQLLHDNIAYFDALERACRAFLRANPLAAPADGADLITLTGCRYEDVTPPTDLWRNIDIHYRTVAHAAQLQMMLKWLAWR